jgi:predicted transglutaminase-like cysteine proteinase
MPSDGNWGANMYRNIYSLLSILALSLAGVSGAVADRAPYVAVGEMARSPLGWVEFCAEHVQECAPQRASGDDAAVTTRSWRELVRINKLVNDTVKPMTDLEHFGVIEKWSYPTDGYGDCEDYVLLKRRMLMDAGWPRSALLITVVRDQKGDGHAVLTVSTDKGDFILDNQNPTIRLWSETPYRFVKRQSQNDPNVWVSLGDPRPEAVTASSR